MKYLNRRFDNIKKGFGNKKMIVGIIIRIILVLAVFAGGRMVCNDIKEDAQIYYNRR